MAPDHASIDIRHIPELVRLAEQVCATRRPRMLRRDQQELAILMPPPRKRPPWCAIGHDLGRVSAPLRSWCDTHRHP